MIGAKIGQRGSKGKTLTLSLALAAFVVAGLLLAAKPAQAKTFTVNSTKDRADEQPGNGRCSTGIRIVHNDGGIELECTLRAAIQEANTTAEPDTINFGIQKRKGTNCTRTRVCTISPTSAYPAISYPTTINGYSQPGSSPNTATTGTNAVLKIVLNGSQIVPAGPPGLYVTALDSTIKGLVINGFDAGVILFPDGNQAGEGNRLEGNFIGTNASGTAAVPNRIGVFPTGAANRKNEVVGGNTPAARNLISGNNQLGVDLWDFATVEGNLIGTKKDGTTPLANETGVNVGGSSNTIARNTIASNILHGVRIADAGSTDNRILANSIFGNGLLGIDLGNNGVTNNDAADGDTGPNRLQNFPVLGSALRFPDSTTAISGRLNSTPNSTFTVQFFSSPAPDASGFGEGKTFLGEVQASTNASGDTGTFVFNTNRGAAPVGQYITATATNNATGDTSEFSGAVRVESGILPPDPG